jgi:SpoVK/Ycf46/Vps4 family AAA+-type ATPase
MSTSRHFIALLKSHIEGDEKQFYSVAMQVAAKEAKQGHVKVAQDMRDLIDAARQKGSDLEISRGPVPLVQPRGDLAALLSASYPRTKLANMVLPDVIKSRLARVLHEQKQQERLRSHGLAPRRKLLLIGPPGSGKTMTAAALAGELALPLMTILLEGLITKYMGETAGKLRLIFDAMATTRGVYLFDEFDAIGARRNATNDVGEIRRVLNSFLQFLEKDESRGLVIAATNHPELLDSALFRRFDDVIEYVLPDPDMAKAILIDRLAGFETSELSWQPVLEAASQLSQSDVSRAGDEAAKASVLAGRKRILTSELLDALQERRSTMR